MANSPAIAKEAFENLVIELDLENDNSRPMSEYREAAASLSTTLSEAIPGDFRETMVRVFVGDLNGNESRNELITTMLFVLAQLRDDHQPDDTYPADHQTLWAKAIKTGIDNESAAVIKGFLPDAVRTAEEGEWDGFVRFNKLCAELYVLGIYQDLSQPLRLMDTIYTEMMTRGLNGVIPEKGRDRLLDAAKTWYAAAGCDLTTFLKRHPRDATVKVDYGDGDEDIALNKRIWQDNFSSDLNEFNQDFMYRDIWKRVHDFAGDELLQNQAKEVVKVLKEFLNLREAPHDAMLSTAEKVWHITYVDERDSIVPSRLRKTEGGFWFTALTQIWKAVLYSIVAPAEASGARRNYDEDFDNLERLLMSFPYQTEFGTKVGRDHQVTNDDLYDLCRRLAVETRMLCDSAYPEIASRREALGLLCQKLAA